MSTNIIMGDPRNGNGFEFVRADCNYPQLLFAEQAGLPVSDLFYQVIVPLTHMDPSTTTVYVAKEFQQHWKSATYRALKVKSWARNGWKTCSPLERFLAEDVDILIKKNLVPIAANVGDVVIFSSLLPHRPNLNAGKELRIAAYPFFAPFLSEQSSYNHLAVKSYLPNSLASVHDSVLNGTCPQFSAHPWCDYKLSTVSQRAFPILPKVHLPRSLLGDCLFGFRPCGF